MHGFRMGPIPSKPPVGFEALCEHVEDGSPPNVLVADGGAAGRAHGIEPVDPHVVGEVEGEQDLRGEQPLVLVPQSHQKACDICVAVHHPLVGSRVHPVWEVPPHHQVRDISNLKSAFKESVGLRQDDQICHAGKGFVPTGFGSDQLCFERHLHSDRIVVESKKGVDHRGDRLSVGVEVAPAQRLVVLPVSALTLLGAVECRPARSRRLYANESSRRFPEGKEAAKGIEGRNQAEQGKAEGEEEKGKRRQAPVGGGECSGGGEQKGSSARKGVKDLARRHKLPQQGRFKRVHDGR